MEKILSYYKKYRQIIHYLIAGGLTTAVSLSVYYLLVLTVLDPQSGVQLQAANIVSWVVAVTFAYYVNRKYVFESRSDQVVREAAAFYVARLGTLFMDMLIMFVFVTKLGMNDKLIKLVVQVVVTVANYILSKLMVFR
ncbi:MAG: GtrA family protein [Lachnospiraceae bacterium]